MTGRQRMVLRLLPLLAAVPILGASAQGQTAHVDPYQNGAAPAFPGRGMASAAASSAAAANANAAAAQAAAAGYVNPMIIDPMAASYMYGPGIPMTRGQVGLSAISSMQQFTGFGSGRISGVRGGGEPAPQTAAHTRNSNIVGGQASRYFNRVQPRGFGGAAAPVTPAATTIAAGNSRKFYQRESRYFPQPAR